MKKYYLLITALFIGIQTYAVNDDPPHAGKNEARKIATAVGACTLPDGSMGKMTVVERETSYSTSSSSTQNSGSHSTTGSASFSAGTSGVNGSMSGSHTYNSGSSSRTGGSESTTREKQECRPLPRW